MHVTDVELDSFSNKACSSRQEVQEVKGQTGCLWAAIDVDTNEISAL